MTKTDFSVLTDGEIKDMFCEWVDKQHPEVEYNFGSYGGCAVGLFLKAHGVDADRGLFLPVDDFRVYRVTHLRGLQEALIQKPWTLGHLAIRLDKVAA